jgi:cyclic pyranopterin phosphate synthase
MGDKRLTHLDAAGRAHMVGVGEKPITKRSATAEAVVAVSPELAEAIRRDGVKKGDVLAVARLAGVAAAKRTGELIPMCHPLPLDKVAVRADLVAEGVRIEAMVEATWRTGVEMEALTAASVAALTVIDMGKSIDRAATIRHVRLLEKTGGQRGDYRADDASPQRLSGFTARVITVSDRSAAGTRADASGPAVGELLGSEAADVGDAVVVPDEPDEVESALRQAVADDVALILTTGGTGLAPRDVTPEATARVLDKPHPQLIDLAQRRLTPGFPKAALSRGLAGVAGRSLILNLPGSPKGARETLEALLDVLPHALKVLRNEDDPHTTPAAEG